MQVIFSIVNDLIDKYSKQENITNISKCCFLFIGENLGNEDNRTKEIIKYIPKKSEDNKEMIIVKDFSDLNSSIVLSKNLNSK